MAEAKPGLHDRPPFQHRVSRSAAANHYLEFLPYIDRPWFGESFNYKAMTPDQWLVQVSGIPFGLMGEMLHEGGNPWRGAALRHDQPPRLAHQRHRCDPRPVWKSLGPLRHRRTRK